MWLEDNDFLLMSSDQGSNRSPAAPSAARYEEWKNARRPTRIPPVPEFSPSFPRSNNRGYLQPQPQHPLEQFPSSATQTLPQVTNNVRSPQYGLISFQTEKLPCTLIYSQTFLSPSIQTGSSYRQHFKYNQSARLQAQGEDKAISDSVFIWLYTHKNTIKTSQ